MMSLQAHALAVAPCDQPVAIMFDFMNPLRAGRRLVGQDGNARLNEPDGKYATLWHPQGNSPDRAV
jgi:hypothetical protein